MATPSPNVTIIGSGMAGCGAAHHLAEHGVRPVMFDKNDYPGGHTATYVNDGWVFDDGPHISFTKNERLQELFAASVDGRFEKLRAYVNNYWRGHWIKHPAQCNLHGLPEDVVVGCIRDFVHAQHNDYGEIRNYEDWLLASFGETFTRNFPGQYTRKYHTCEAKDMTTDWLGPRLYRPDLEEVLRGALSPSTADVHYVDHFRYPTEGGFVAYIEPFHAKADLQLGKQVVGVDPKEKTVMFADGRVHEYGALISTMPLPELIPIIAGAPADVIDAAGKLACTTCVLVNVGFDRPDLTDAYWTYFYDEDISFTRLSFPYKFSEKTTPPGCSSVQVEHYFSDKYKPLAVAPEELIAPTVRDLRKCGLMRPDEEPAFTSVIYVKYANIIFDLDRPKAIDVVHGYLEDVGVVPAGRYGHWGYQWTDESFALGEEAAAKVLAQR